MESPSEELISHCYCKSTATTPQMFTCTECKLKFHITCLKSGRPSDLAGDVYFKFTCTNCSPEGIEFFNRLKLSWTTVLMISLYNLQLQGGGKCGYFRWREHICRFIDKNWVTLFGTDKRKSGTWQGTVAGCLSNGANRFFLTGHELFGENGWWTLKSQVLPSPEEVEAVNNYVKPNRKRKKDDLIPIVEGSRRKNSNILEAALSLKEKKASVVESSPKIRRRHSHSKSDIFPPNHKIKLIVPKAETLQNSSGGDSSRVIPKIIIKTERVSPQPDEESNSHWLKNSDSMDQDQFNYSTSLDSSNTFNSLLEDVFTEISSDKFSAKPSPFRNESEEENSSSGKTIKSLKKLQQHVDISRKKKAVTKDESPLKENIVSESKFTMMSIYDEEQLLVKLESYQNAMKQKPEIRRLYRKLVVRKLKRERNLPVFDIDAEVRAIRGMDPPEYYEREVKSKGKSNNLNTNTILDRYQIKYCNSQGKFQRYSSFITRLMGLEDEQQESIISPYTERILKPFIFRDYSTKPLKLQLLEEIILRTNKSNPDFEPPKQSPIDYCYVRPQHIPPINALCHEYFWPGIDLSETLQYPDFSCVALYRKIIIGFAFMVPDIKYNEAYITFVFCHPEWQRAGIATFMIYHLIQTCMGKDITLHVSATSSAVYLYEKFGFKVEEFIRDYYDKYLPTDSKECRHALFLRLRR